MFDYSPLLISLRSASIASLIALVFGLCAARFTLNANKKISLVCDALFTLPMVLPPTVLGFFLLIILGRTSLLGRFLFEQGISIVFTWYATVIAAAVVAFPLMYRGAKGALAQVNTDLIWAGRTLGMSEFSIFIKVMIPESLPGISASLALSFARALGEFGATMMIAGNIPQQTQTIPMAIYFSTASGDMQTAWIWVLVISILSFLSLWLINIFTSKESS
ncbi:MAG: molybdate ABC transporter permease subunit [Treponemataceae bacterium]